MGSFCLEPSKKIWYRIALHLQNCHFWHNCDLFHARRLEYCSEIRPSVIQNHSFHIVLLYWEIHHTHIIDPNWTIGCHPVHHNNHIQLNTKKKKKRKLYLFPSFQGFSCFLFGAIQEITISRTEASPLHWLSMENNWIQTLSPYYPNFLQPR